MSGRDETTRPVLSVGAVATTGNDLLVVRRRSDDVEGLWSVPTTAVTAGETMVEAAARSVAEQAGLGALSGPFLGWWESIGDDRHDVVACFSSVVLDRDEPVAGPDVVEARWMPVWDVAELPLTDGLAELLADHGVIDTLA